MLTSITGRYRRAFAGLPRRVWILSGVGLLTRSGTMVVPFLGLYLTQELALPKTEAGLVLALWGVGSVGSAFLGGWATDRFGPDRVLIASLVGGAVGLLLLPRFDRVVPLAIAIFVVSVVAESFRPAVMSAVAGAVPPEKRARALALLRLAVNAGMAVGPAVGGFLAVIDYDLLFVVDALTCLGAAGFLALHFEAAPPAPSASMAPPALRDGPFLALLGLNFTMALVFFQILAAFPVYLREGYGLAENGIGLVLACNTALIIVFEMVLIHAVEERHPARVAGIGAALVCIGFGLLPFGRSFSFLLVTVAIWTLGEMLAMPMTNAMVATRAPEGQLGRFMGAYGLSFSIAMTIAPMAGLGIYGRFGPRTLWVGVLVLAPLLLLGFFRLAPHWSRPRGGPTGATSEGPEAPPSR